MSRTKALILRSLLAAGLALSLAGCEGLRDTLGLTKSTPDEFAVVTKAPLTLPPEFALRPPEPGAVRPQEQQPRQAAERVLTGRPVVPGSPDASSAESAFLRQAGAASADPKIRQVVNAEFTQLAERDRSFTDRLLLFTRPDPPGTVVDAPKEAQRLRENSATGRPATSGDTPVIKRRQRGILEGLF